MKKRHSAEQIVGRLRQADVALGKELKVPEVCRQLGISEQTYYRWRQKNGGNASTGLPSKVAARRTPYLKSPHGRRNRKPRARYLARVCLCFTYEALSVQLGHVRPAPSTARYCCRHTA